MSDAALFTAGIVVEHELPGRRYKCATNGQRFKLHRRKDGSVPRSTLISSWHATCHSAQASVRAMASAGLTSRTPLRLESRADFRPFVRLKAAGQVDTVSTLDPAAAGAGSVARASSQARRVAISMTCAPSRSLSR